MSGRRGRCRGCGAEGVPLAPTLIPEDTTANKLAVLELCRACSAARGARPADRLEQ